MSATLVSGVVALAALTLGLWGLNNPAHLVTPGVSEERRARDERRIRRGARSMLVMAGLFAALAVLPLVEGAATGTTP